MSYQLAPWKSKTHYPVLLGNIAHYLKQKHKPHALALCGQPFDSFFLTESKLFKKSRELFLKQKGSFESRLVTSARSLSSTILLENRIQYSPTQDEIFWVVSDTNQSIAEKQDALKTLVSYSVSLFHEQNHRIFWNLVPPPSDLSEEGLRRALHLSEAMVVAMDMALGDELGPEFSSLGYLSGALYDPGSYAKFKNQREKWNYYHLVVRATYLLLEGFNKKKLLRTLPKLAGDLSPELAEHAVERSLRLDDQFVFFTNPEWQTRNKKIILSFFTKQSKKHKKSIDLPDDADQWLDPYLAFEQVLKTFFK